MKIVKRSRTIARRLSRVRVVRSYRFWLVLVVVAGFVVIGAIRIFGQAATYTGKAEAESSTQITGRASFCNNGTASQGKAVSFGSSAQCPVSAPALGKRVHIYDPKIGSQAWYVNDHSIIYDEPTKTYHIIGIQHTTPAICSLDETRLGHAVSTDLSAPNSFVRKADAMTALRNGDEDFLWAPHIIKVDNLYYMYYATSKGTSCSGYIDHNFRIKLATSPDLYNWTRVGTMFQDGFDGRDPFITRIGNQWVIYYTATQNGQAGSPAIVAYRTSTDLRNWSSRKVAATIYTQWVFSESPVVMQRHGMWYLFVGNSFPQPHYDIEHVYKSTDPFNFNTSTATTLNTHAGEIIQDTKGAWWMTHSGWNGGGVYLAPLYW